MIFNGVIPQLHRTSDKRTKSVHSHPEQMTTSSYAIHPNKITRKEIMVDNDHFIVTPAFDFSMSLFVLPAM